MRHLIATLILLSFSTPPKVRARPGDVELIRTIAAEKLSKALKEMPR